MNVGHLTEARRQELAPIVRKYARRALAQTLPRYRDRVELSDVEQSAWVILSNYLRTYDPQRGAIGPWARRVLFLRLGAEVYKLARPIRIPHVRGDRANTMAAAVGVVTLSTDIPCLPSTSSESRGVTMDDGIRTPFSVREQRWATEADGEAYTIAERAWAAADGDMAKFAAEVRRQLGIEPAPRAWRRG